MMIKIYKEKKMNTNLFTLAESLENNIEKSLGNHSSRIGQDLWLYAENLRQLIENESTSYGADEQYKIFPHENNIDNEFVRQLVDEIAPEIERISEHLQQFYNTQEPLLDGFFLQNISREIYRQKYALYNSNGERIERTVFDSLMRVALAVASVELRYQENAEKRFKRFVRVLSEFFVALATKQFSGGGRIMANAGAGLYKNNTTLINCLVMLQIDDSIEGIMEVAKQAAMALKSGAGVGYNFSTIRPKGAYVYGAGSETSGVVSFMEIFDKTCSTIMSAGGRRGAQMATLHVEHPEIRSFITAKREDGMLRYFNLSVLPTESFMQKVEANKDLDLWFWEKTDLTFEDIVAMDRQNELVTIVAGDIPYAHPDANYFLFDEAHAEVTSGNTAASTVYRKKVYETVPANEIYDLIMQSNYDFAEPGFILIDRINEMNPLAPYGEHIQATNPCGEQPLPPTGACCLGSLFLHTFVKDPFNFDLEPKANFNYELFRKSTSLANRFLDNVNDITNLPLDSFKREAWYKRRHGLGVTGVSDVLSAVGLSYGTSDSVAFLDRVFQNLAAMSLKSSIDLAREKVPAPIYQELGSNNIYRNNYYRSVFGNLSKDLRNLLPEPDLVQESVAEAPSMRFSHATSIAPTGTMSLSWADNAANGIEPTFGHTYVRNIRIPGKLAKTQERVFSLAYLWYLNTTNITHSDTNSPLENSVYKGKNANEFLRTTSDVDVDGHIAVQSVAQLWIDSSCSKTCNVPTDYDYDAFKQAYLNAWKMGLKGFTTFRMNPSFSIGVLTRDEDLASIRYSLVIEDENGNEQVREFGGNETVVYQGETMNVANLVEALKENILGKM